MVMQRGIKVFCGTSHPVLGGTICERLGTAPAECDLKKFSNGEISVNINTSIRNRDCYVIQSGSKTINDAIMEMCILISACKGGSAYKITAVMPYFPYSRQSKKKSHRGAITARLLANLLAVSGINHVITVDLHAPPSQGFFGKPIDNLHAEPLISRWIRTNVTGWEEAIVVSKNPGGTKRVTSLADNLQLNFGLVTTDRRRTTVPPSMEGSGIFEKPGNDTQGSNNISEDDTIHIPNGLPEDRTSHCRTSLRGGGGGGGRPQTNGTSPHPLPYRHLNNPPTSSPLTQSTRVDSTSPPTTRNQLRGDPPENTPSRALDFDDDDDDQEEEYTDERATEVITGRLVHGHIVDDDAPSPVISAMSNSVATLPGDLMGSPRSPTMESQDPMAMSFLSTASRFNTDHLGGSIDPTEHSDDEEEGFKDPGLEHTVTLVGNVRDRIVIIMDDMIDQAGSWIAAAETVVKRGDAKKVYCIATHGIFGDESLEQMQACECIDHIVVTNTYPIEPERARVCRKLKVLDISGLLAEAIRRNHYGESITDLFQNFSE